MNQDQWHEPMRFEIVITEVKSDCRVNHQVGEKFTAEYRTPSPEICGECYIGMYPLISAMRVGGDMRRLGKKHPLKTTYTCPSRVVRFNIKGIPQCNECGKELESLDDLTRVKGAFPMDVCNECAAKFT